MVGIHKITLQPSSLKHGAPYPRPDVMPPDENQEHANNSIFTNVVANLAVSTARWTTCLASGEGAALAAIPDEWLDKMRNLVFLFNEEERYHEEYEGFDQQLQQGKE